MNKANLKQYIDNGGTRCPNPECKSEDLVGGFVQIEAGRAHQEVYCSTCGAEWEDVYTLTSVENHTFDEVYPAFEPATWANTVDWHTGEERRVEFKSLDRWIDEHGKSVIVRPPTLKMQEEEPSWMIFTSNDGLFRQR